MKWTFIFMNKALLLNLNTNHVEKPKFDRIYLSLYFIFYLEIFKHCMVTVVCCHKILMTGATFMSNLFNFLKSLSYCHVSHFP